MISIKAAVIAATAVGAVAAGGVTWASVAQPDATPSSAHGKLPAVENKAKQVAPKVAPTCLPASELAKKGKEAAAKGTGAVREQAPKVQENLPQVPGQPGPGGAQVPAAKPGVPNAELPACPDVKNLPKPDARVPAAPQAPQLPDVTQLRCDKLAPAVEVGSPLERTIMLSKGLKYVAGSGKAAPRQLGTTKACAVTQKWVSRVAGTASWITVERIKTPAQMTEQQVRSALEVPTSAVRSTTANGTVVLQTPGGHSGVLLIDPAGYALFVDGRPVAGTGLQDVATQLAKVRG
jgi:hypothetical protein